MELCFKGVSGVIAVTANYLHLFDWLNKVHCEFICQSLFQTDRDENGFGDQCDGPGKDK